MSKKLIELASEIVNAQSANAAMSAEEISTALRQVFNTLHELQRTEAGEIDLSKARESEEAAPLKPENSIRNDKVICLECGAEMRQLTKLHLVAHGMTAKEYKKKYGFTMGTPLAAKSLTRARSRAAKKRGVPENLLKYMEAKRQAKVETGAVKVEAAAAAAQPVSDTPGTARARRVRSRFSPKVTS